MNLSSFTWRRGTPAVLRGWRIFKMFLCLRRAIPPCGIPYSHFCPESSRSTPWLHPILWDGFGIFLLVISTQSDKWKIFRLFRSVFSFLWTNLPLNSFHNLTRPQHSWASFGHPLLTERDILPFSVRRRGRGMRLFTAVSRMKNFWLMPFFFFLICLDKRIFLFFQKINWNFDRNRYSGVVTV